MKRKSKSGARKVPSDPMARLFPKGTGSQFVSRMKIMSPINKKRSIFDQSYLPKRK